MSGGFVLWNSAIWQYIKVVPYAIFFSFSANLPLKKKKKIHCVAFGYDHNSNDYKVVRTITYRRSTELSIIDDKYNFVYVYTFSTDFWRQINTVILMMCLWIRFQFILYFFLDFQEIENKKLSMNIILFLPAWKLHIQTFHSVYIYC